MLKPPAGEGYFDDVFAIDADGKRIALDPHRRRPRSRSSRSSRWRRASRWADSPCPARACFRSRWSCWRGNAGVVIVGREKSDDLAPLFAFRFDGAGKPAGKVGPATAFGRPPADGTARARLLVAFTRKLGTKGAEATFTVAPYDVATLAPAGKPRVHKVDVSGELKPPGVRFIGFFDGYTRVLSERPGDYDKKADVRAAVQDGDHRRDQRQGGEGRRQIADIAGWAQTGQLRQRAPGAVRVRRAQ